MALEHGKNYVQTVPQLLQTLWQHEQAYRDQIAMDLTIPTFPKAA